MRRFLTESRLFCFLTALLVVPPGVSLASLLVCQCEPVPVVSVAEVNACCALPVEQDAPSPDPDGPDDESCDNCDCPMICCSPVKAPAGVTGLPVPISSFRSLSFFEVGADRDEGVGAVFKIAHPPKL